MTVLWIPSLTRCQFLMDTLTCSMPRGPYFGQIGNWDLKMKIWPTSGLFGENRLLKLVLVCLILTQWWNKKNVFTSPLREWQCWCYMLAFIIVINIAMVVIVSSSSRWWQGWCRACWPPASASAHQLCNLDQTTSTSTPDNFILFMFFFLSNFLFLIFDRIGGLTFLNSYPSLPS